MEDFEDVALAKAMTAVENYKQSRQLAADGELEAAVLAGMRSLESKIDRFSHYENLARLLVENNMHRSAELVVQGAFALGFDKPVLHSLLARVMFKQKRYADGIAAMDKAVAQSGGNAGYERYRDMLRSKLDAGDA